MSISTQNKNFLSYRKSCPICNSNLSLTFYTYFTNINDNSELQFILQLSPLRRGMTYYNAICRIDVESNSFNVDFSNKDNYILNTVSLSVLKRFKDYIHNMKGVHLKFRCNNNQCYYYYNSAPVIFDYSKGKINNLSVCAEYIHYYNNDDLYSIYNDFTIKNSTVNIVKDYKVLAEKGKTFSEMDKKIDIPLIEFNEKESFTKKLDTLLWYV